MQTFSLREKSPTLCAKIKKSIEQFVEMFLLTMISQCEKDDGTPVV